MYIAVFTFFRVKGSFHHRKREGDGQKSVLIHAFQIKSEM